VKNSPIADAPEMVLAAESGHLFLRGDGNRCHEQHLGQFPIDAHVASEWARHINALHQLRTERTFDFCFLPAPDKQSVYWEHIADVADHRNILAITRLLDPRLYHDPLDELIRLRRDGPHDPYPKVDSHWNSYAASQVLESLLARWRIKWSSDSIVSAMTKQEFEGDLGIKTVPRTSGTALNLDPKVWRPLLRYDNGVPDNGRIRVFGNSNAPVAGRLLIVGDSFSYRLVEIAALVFAEVYQFHGSFIDRPFLRLIQPDYFVFEQTDRFFVRPPRHSVESSFARLIEEKLEGGVAVAPLVERHRTLTTLRLASLHQSLVVALAERHLTSFGLVPQTYEIAGLASSLRTIRSVL
jgi:hypothetical protein